MGASVAETVHHSQEEMVALDYLDLGVSRASVYALAIVGLVPVLKLMAREVTDLILLIRSQVRRILGR